MNTNLMRVTFKQLFLAFAIAFFCLASLKAFAQTTSKDTTLTPSEKDVLAELGLTLEDLNVGLGRAPAELTPPTPTPAPKNLNVSSHGSTGGSIEEMITSANAAIADAFFPPEEEKASKKPASVSSSPSAIPAETGIQPPSGEKKYDLTPPTPPKEDRVHYKPGDKSVLAKKFDTTDPITRRHVLELQEKADTYPKKSDYTASNPNVFYPKPVEPKKEEPIQITFGQPPLPEQNLMNQLKEYENIVKTKDLNEKQTQKLLDEYKKLLNLPQKEATPVEVTVQTPQPVSTRQQELALESLSRMINDEKLQREKPDFVYNQIIQGLLVPKMDDAAKNLDVPMYSKAAETIRYVHNPTDPNLKPIETTHKEQFIKRDSDLNNKITALLEDIDESIIDGISSDLLGTVQKLENAAKFLEENMLLTAKMRHVHPYELWQRFKNEKGILSEDERFATIKVLSEMMSEGQITPSPEEKREMMAFVENYLKRFEQKSSALASEEKDCKDKESLEKDKEKFEKTLENIRTIASQLEQNPTKVAKAELDRLIKFESLVRQVREKLIASLEKMDKKDKAYYLTKRGIVACGKISCAIEEMNAIQHGPIGRKATSNANRTKSSSSDFSDLLNKE